MYKLKLLEPLIGWVHCVRSSITAEDNCCFLYTFPSGWLRFLPHSDVYGSFTRHHGCKIAKLIFTTEIFMPFFWQVHHREPFFWVVKFLNPCLVQPLLPLLHHGSWPTSHNVVMLKICFCPSTHHNMAGVQLCQLRICHPILQFHTAVPSHEIHSKRNSVTSWFCWSNTNVFLMHSRSTVLMP